MLWRDIDILTCQFFLKIYNFFPNWQFFSEFPNFYQNLQFSSKFLIFYQIFFFFSQNLQYFLKIYNFFSKFTIFSQNLQFFLFLRSFLVISRCINCKNKSFSKKQIRSKIGPNRIFAKKTTVFEFLRGQKKIEGQKFFFSS